MCARSGRAVPATRRCSCTSTCRSPTSRASVEDAVALGATLAEFQPQEDVRVLLDPAGHPFCLYL